MFEDKVINKILGNKRIKPDKKSKNLEQYFDNQICPRCKIGRLHLINLYGYDHFQCDNCGFTHNIKAL